MKIASHLLLSIAAIPALAAFLPSAARAESAADVTDDDLALARNPIMIRTRVVMANEYKDLDGGGSSDKLYLGGVYGFGFNGHDRDFGIAFELPMLFNNPVGGDSASGVGDFKLRFGRLFIDEPLGWRAGCFFENEFDTAADNVQAIANQRNQMAFGGGGAYSILSNFVLSSTLQFGWSNDAGATNGHKSEWEAHLTATVKLPENVSLNLDYKAVVNMMDGGKLFNTVEPSVGWALGEKKTIGLFASCEIPLNDSATNVIAKAGVNWFF